MKPEFNDEENYVIAFYRDKTASSTSRLNLLDGMRILVATGFFIHGLIKDDLLWSIIAFGILLFGDFRRMFENHKMPYSQF